MPGAMYALVAMYSMTDLQRILGLTRSQVRWRLAALAKVDGLLDNQVDIGPKGRKEYSSGVLEMLREMDELVSHAGQDVDAAAEEIGKKVRRERTPADSQDMKAIDRKAEGEGIRLIDPLVAMVLEEKDERIEEKNAQILQLESEVQYLRRRVDELMPLALPKPRRRWWPFSRVRVMN